MVEAKQLYTEILQKDEVNRLSSRLSPGIREIFKLGSYSGMDLGDILSLKPAQLTGRQEIQLAKRVVIIPLSISRALASYAKTRRTPLVWPLTMPSYAEAYQIESQEIIGKPISWKAVRRTYIWHASGAGHPSELICQNTGVEYIHIKKWLQNGQNYKPIVNSSRIYDEVQ